MGTEWSVTEWIEGVKAGDELAAQRLWERYFERLVQFARGKLRGMPRRASDEEDLALSAFCRFCTAAREGRFPKLSDRDSMWKLVMKIAADKAVDLRRKAGAAIRGGGRELGESALMNTTGSESEVGMGNVVGDCPTPEFAAVVAEEFRRLLDCLDDDELRAIAIARLEGCTDSEIADRVGCALRTVQRRLRVIRKTWGQEAIG
jgi:DNA-directed RNA polymerase specialized sigma24 family protein